MKSYGQICAVARSLDIVGDRWNLLIVRELLISRRLRFTDLQRGLPGVAPNLLAQRLRALESHDVLRRETASPPATGTLYVLTDRGMQLEGVVRELLRWGAGTVADAPPGAAFQMHWLSIPARYLTRDNTPAVPAATIRFGTTADGFDMKVSAGLVTVAPCEADATPDATIDGPGAILVGLLQGTIDLAGAIVAGMTIHGDSNALQRILPTIS
jgi:DNA-binding HxlR family transcriptional regulator